MKISRLSPGCLLPNACDVRLGRFSFFVELRTPGQRSEDLIVYLALQRDPESAIVLSLVLLAVSLATLLLLRGRWLGRARPSRRAARGPAVDARRGGAAVG